MHKITSSLLTCIVSAATIIVLTSYVLLNDPLVILDECVEENSSCVTTSFLPPLLTSTGDFLGWYTDLQFNPLSYIIDVHSFPPMNGAPTVLSNSWSTKHYTPTSFFSPTNTSAYDPVTKELLCLISGEQQMLTYEDNPMSSSLFNMAPATATAPLYLNGTVFGIEVENNGYASGAMVDFDLISITTQSGLLNGIAPLQFTTNNPAFYRFDHASMSSATNRIDEIYFLSGSNLVIIPNPGITTTVVYWTDLAKSNTPGNFEIYFGLEYKKPGVLLAFRERYVSGAIVGTELVEILFSSTTYTVNAINILYDIHAHIPSSLDGPWRISNEYFSTTYYACTDAYYISTLYDSPTKSRLIEIDIPGATHFEQHFPDYLFGIEWKLTCPCQANYTFEQIDCDDFQFNSTSTSQYPISYSWDFGDLPSGPNNYSALQNPAHQFTTCGAYNVCLTITGNFCNSTICQIVQVTDIIPPTAICKSGFVISLDAACPVTLTNADIDNGSFDDCQIQSISISPSIISQCGVHTVTMTVTDWCGNTDQCATIVTAVDNTFPVITCPANVNLTSAANPCLMVVNNIKWTSLSDNCAIPAVTYTITGATTLSGNGDASGNTFSQGTSIVKYTATDNCGHTATCTFKVVLDCPCVCPTNMIQNPGFSAGAVAGSLGPTGQSSFWNRGNISTSHPYPSVNTSKGCCDPVSMDFSGTWQNPSIYQTGLSFLAGHHYQISFCAERLNNNNFQYAFVAANTPLSPTFHPYNCSNCLIGVNSTNPQNGWVKYTLPIWTPSQFRDVLYVRPFTFFTAGGMDNICVEEVFYICGSSENAFVENSNNATNIQVDEIADQAVVDIGNLLECNRISVVDWGDGSDTLGPFGGNIQLRHHYADTNEHEIKVTFQELDTSGQVIFQTIIAGKVKVRGYNTKYFGGPQQSVFNLSTGITTWAHDFTARDKGGRINVKSFKYNIETALQKPVGFPDPIIELKNENGLPVTTKAGEVIQMLTDEEVAAKAELRYPAEPGYAWVGFQSNLLTPTDADTSEDLSFTVSFTWTDLPSSAQDSSGFIWISDNKDELYGEQILEGFGFFGPAVEDTTTALKDFRQLEDISLFPNPAKDELKINWKDVRLDNPAFEILDCSGRLVLKTATLHEVWQVSIDVKSLNEGLYFVKILASGKPVGMLKFVKVK